MQSLPVEICAAKSLKALYLNGLTSGNGCKEFFWGPGLRKKPFKFLGTYSPHTIGSPLPACILTLPNLTALHLSGLGLPGSIPNVVFSPSLIDLSLSHNALTGVLPDSLQSRLSSFESVDLSFNKISGIFTGDVCRTGCSYKYGESLDCTPDSPGRTDSCFMELNLKVNRLSGKLPSTSLTWKNVSVLEGNMFSCDARRGGKDLPQNDPFYENFSCGSTVFVTMFLFWFFTLSLGLALVIFRERKEEVRLEKLTQEGKEESAARNYLSFKAFAKMLLAFVESDWHKENTKEVHIKFCGMQVPVHRMVPVVFASVAQVDSVKVEEHLSSSKGSSRMSGRDGDRSSQVVHISFDQSRSSVRHSSVDVRHGSASLRHGSVSLMHSESLASQRRSSAGESTLSVDLAAADAGEGTYEIPIVVSKMLECMNELHALTVIVLLLSIGLMMTYGISSPFTCFLKNTYAWSITTAYRTGTACAVVFFLLWSACLTLVTGLITLQKKNRRLTFGELDSNANTSISVEKGSNSDDLTKVIADGQGDGIREERQNVAFGTEWSAPYMSFFLFARIAIISIINFVVVFTVNASYVYIVIKYAREIQNAAKFSLVVFMLSWNKIVIPSMLHSKHRFNAVWRLGMAHSRIYAFMDDYFNGITFDIVLLTINIVLVPIFATLSTSKTCFLGTFRAEDPLVSTYHFTYISHGRTLPWTASTTFTPTFTYSYACSSLLTTLYSPIYIGVAMWTTCAVPVLRHLAARINEGRRRKLGLRRYFVQSLSDFVLLLTNGIVCPLAGISIGMGIITRTVIMQYHIVSFAIDDANYNKKSLESARGGKDAIPEGSKMIALFWGEEQLVTWLRWVVDYFWPPKAEEAESKSAAAKIEEFVKECYTQVPENPIYMARWVLYFFPPLLLAFFEFDIAGDALGHSGAAWAPVIMIFVPWVMIALYEATEKGVWAALRKRSGPTLASPPLEQPGPDEVVMQGNPMIASSRLSAIAETHLRDTDPTPRLHSDSLGAISRLSLEMVSTSQLDVSRDSVVSRF